METQLPIIITILIIIGIIIIIKKIINLIKRGFYKIASIYIALTAGSGGGITYLITDLINNTPQ